MEKAISILLIALMLAGCQTTTLVNINTNVPDAMVIVDGKIIGTTPIQETPVKNSSGKRYHVIIQKEGYEIYQGALTTETKTANATATVIGYALGILILPLFLCINALWMEGPQENQYFILKAETPQT
jgi:hypothetical protein